MRKTIFTTAIVLAMSSGMALAQSVSAGFPNTIAGALKDLGHNSELTTDSYGDPMITANFGDLKYSVLFYGCKDNTNCKDIQFRASFERGTKASDADIAGFNAEWMVGKTYIGSSGSPLIEHPVMGVDGLSRASFERTLTRWVTAMGDFRDVLY